MNQSEQSSAQTDKRAQMDGSFGSLRSSLELRLSDRYKLQ